MQGTVLQTTLLLRFADQIVRAFSECPVRHPWETHGYVSPPIAAYGGAGYRQGPLTSSDTSFFHPAPPLARMAVPPNPHCIGNQTLCVKLARQNLPRFRSGLSMIARLAPAVVRHTNRRQRNLNSCRVLTEPFRQIVTLNQRKTAPKKR